MSSSSSNVYEQWVLGLRSWRADPLTNLSDLPKLDETSFPPATYNRLINHLNEAINEFMKRWNRQLSSAVGAAKEPHTLARALVDARLGLAHRLKLARHPSLPATISKQLVTQAETDIRSLQRQLEEGAQHAASSGSSVGRTEKEAILRLYRDNALTAVLDAGFSLDGVNDREVQRANAAEDTVAYDGTPAEPFTLSSPKRRIFLSPQQE